MSSFYGIAIAGKKAAGKDMTLDHLRATRHKSNIVRCKTPIVEAYEKIVGHPYEKSRDDAELIEVSRTVIRGGPNGNDNICKDYLVDNVPDFYEKGLVFIPDMRRHPENEACHDILNLMCLHVWASDETRRERILARDGHLNNWIPDDSTEMDVESLKYHYEVDNDRPDNGRHAILQLETYLGRLGSNFVRQPNFEAIQPGVRVRMIDPFHPFYFEEGIVHQQRSDQYGSVYVVFDNRDQNLELVSDLVKV